MTMLEPPPTPGGPAAGATGTPGAPAVVGRDAWQAELEALRVREKAHTRDGDAIAAARRRLPMVEVDPAIALTGPEGPVTLLEVFEGRQQATLCQGPYDDSVRYRDFISWDMPWYSAQDAASARLAGHKAGMMHLVSYLRHAGGVLETYSTALRGVEAMDYSYALVDMTVRAHGRPTAQWPRLDAGHSDHLSTAGS